MATETITLDTAQQLVDASPTAMMVVGREGRIVAVNAVAAQLFGWSIAELLVRKVEDLIPERFRALHREQRVHFDGVSRGMGTRVGLFGVRSDGSEFNADVGLGPVGGELIAVTVIDVSERERLGAELREREAQLRLFIDHAPVALAMLDRDMRYLAASERWIADFGLRGQDLAGRPHYEVFKGGTGRWRAAHARALTGEIVREEEDRVERKDGSAQWLRWEVRPWKAHSGQIGGTVIFTEDITSRKAAEQDRERLRAQIDRQRLLLQTIVDNMPSGLAVCEGPEHRYELVNRAQMQIACGRGPLVGRTPAEIWPEGAEGAMQALLDRVYRMGEPASLRDVQNLVERGHPAKEAYFDIDCVPMHDARQRVTGLLVVTNDRTEQARARHRIEENEALVHRLRSRMERVLAIEVASQTVAAIAHELNQPLAAVVTYSDAALRLLQQGNPKPGQLERALQAGAEQAQRAGRVVRELLNLLQKGQSRSEAVDLAEAVTTALEIAQRDEHGRFRAVVDIAAGLPRVRANQQQLEKVLINLLRNSAEAMRSAATAAPEIAIAVERVTEEDMALVTVRDNGPGLGTEASKRVFEPFFTTKSDGLGMGLAICRSIIESHGGKLWVGETAEDGATFCFTLPFQP